MSQRFSIEIECATCESEGKWTQAFTLEGSEPNARSFGQRYSLWLRDLREFEGWSDEKEVWECPECRAKGAEDAEADHQRDLEASL